MLGIKKKISKNSMLIFSCSIVVLFISLIINAAFAYDDSVLYRNVYLQLNTTSYENLAHEYFRIVGSLEPIHMHIMWILSNLGFSYELVQSVLNALLTYFFLKTSKFSNFKTAILFLTLILSYYHFILFFELERLKLAILFLFCYLSRATEDEFTKLSLLILITLSQIQILILLISVLIANNYSSILRISEGYLNRKIIAVIILFIFLSISIMDHII